MEWLRRVFPTLNTEMAAEIDMNNQGSPIVQRPDPILRMMKHRYCMARPSKIQVKHRSIQTSKRIRTSKSGKVGRWAYWYSRSRSLHLPLRTSEQLVAIQAKKPPSLGAWKNNTWAMTTGRLRRDATWCNFDATFRDFTLAHTLPTAFKGLGLRPWFPGHPGGSGGNDDLRILQPFWPRKIAVAHSQGLQIEPLLQPNLLRSMKRQGEKHAAVVFFRILMYLDSCSSFWLTHKSALFFHIFKASASGGAFKSKRVLRAKNLQHRPILHTKFGDTLLCVRRESLFFVAWL